MNFPSGQTLEAHRLERDEQVECDAVVVGTGAGGAASALALAQAGLKVALVEEGRRWQPQELSTRQSWALRHLYAERGTAMAQGNIYLPMPRGRAVGGSTLLNSAICFRAPSTVLTKWQQEFGLGWADAAGLAPVYEEVERTLGVAKTRPDQARTNALTFKRGADLLGFTGDFISRNAPGCIGCGVCQLGCPVGLKGSVDRNMVPQALSLGAALFTTCRATSVLLQGGAAVGVECHGLDPSTETRGRKLTVRARLVFLCAGAIGTPLLLLRQGLANGSGQVGRNLRVHTAVGVCARFEGEINAWHGVTQGYYAHLDGHAAVLETFSSTPELYAIQYQRFARPAKTLKHLASAGCMIGDTSVGSVGLGPSEGRAALRYDVNEADLKVMLRGQREIARAFFAAGAIEVHPAWTGHETFPSVEAMDRVIAQAPPPDRVSIYASHPLGTCRMADSPARGVVKPTGEAWDVRNLYVADASIFPSALGVNPQITVMGAAMTLARGAAKAG